MAVSNDEIMRALNIIEDIIPRLDSLSDQECVEGMALQFDVFKRYLVNIGMEDTTLEPVDRICQSLNNFEYAHSASYSSALPTQAYNGHRGKPSYYIDENQVTFLLARGFKVAEIASMLGVSKRTLERRMQSIGISVAGN